MIKRGRQARLEIFDIAKLVTAVYADAASGGADDEAAAGGPAGSGDGGGGGGDLAGMSDADIEVRREYQS